MGKIKKDIAIVIENLIQFQYIENGINTLLSNNISLDIYVPTSKYSDGFDNLFDNAYNYLQKNNYMPKRLPDNTEYKILLEPYPTEKYFKINHTYRIKYPYSLIAAKPNPSFRPDWNICYDAILCHSEYEASYLKTYAETITLGPLKPKFSKSNSHKEKPILLYLPTYGDLSSIDELINIFNNLKNKYYIIIKFHHGTIFLNNEKDRLEQLKSLADEWYDLNTSLSYLLSKCDIVLSDNSGAIFEALYNDVPVAIFAKNINKKLGEFDTIQHDLVGSDIIPYTNNPNDILKILSLCCSDKYKSIQKNIKDKLFYMSENPEQEFLNIIKSYLNDNINSKYKQLHDVLKNDYNLNSLSINTLKKENHSLYNQIENAIGEIQNLENKIVESENIICTLNNKIEQQNKILALYNNNYIYKAANKIYKLYCKIFKHK